MGSLVYHTGALGDFITALPAMALWKAAHPGEPLVLLGRPAHGALAAHLFDDAWDAGGAEFAGLLAADGRVSPRIVERLSALTSALLFTRESSPVWTSFSRQGVRDLIRQDPFPSGAIHVVDYHLSLFEGRYSEADRTPRIPVGGAGSTKVGVALHHGSGSPRKNWPRERFEELAEVLNGRGERMAWITGPAEPQQPTPGWAEAWRSLPLPQLAGRLARCRLFVGNDSGVTHLAAAAGCPTVALFGASDPRVWSPRGAHVRVLSSPSGRMGDIAIADVLRAGLDLLGEKR